MAGVDMVHVPYRGQAPALTDLMGGQVQADFAPLPPSIEYAKAGKLRALAITSSARSEAFPDLPTLAEFLPGYEATLAAGLGAPRGTPAEVIERINREVNAALADPRIKAQLADLGNAPLPGSPADFGNLVAAEAEKWAKVIRTANLKPE
jgi:tripartite-type tricarboxylate transporter receptor subunit TctC